MCVRRRLTAADNSSDKDCEQTAFGEVHEKLRGGQLSCYYKSRERIAEEDAEAPGYTNPSKPLFHNKVTRKIRQQVTHLVPHPLFRLCAKHALLALGVPRRNQLLSKMVANVLHNGLTLGNDNILLRICRSNGNHWRFSQGVDGLQIRTCALVGIALVDLDVVFEIQLLEQPHDALAARLVQPVVQLDRNSLDYMMCRV